MSTDAPTRPSLTADIAPADRGYRGMPGDNAFDRAIAAAPAARIVPAENSVQNEPVVETPKPAPVKRPRTKSIEPASPVEETPAPAAHRKPRTGAGARFNPDNVWIYRAVNAGVIIVALAAVMASWQGLVAVATWFLPAAWTWVLPIALDVAIVVFTLGILPRKGRGESVWMLSLAAYALTAISAAANALHVILEPLPTVENDMQRYVGAALAALMPMLVLLTTEVLGMLITKPTRAERAREKLAAAKVEAELARTTKAPARKKPAAKKS